MKYEFDLVIRSKTGDVSLHYNPLLRKWVAMQGEKVLAKRKNVSVLIDALNATNSLQSTVEA